MNSETIIRERISPLIADLSDETLKELGCDANKTIFRAIRLLSSLQYETYNQNVSLAISNHTKSIVYFIVAVTQIHNNDKVDIFDVAQQLDIFAASCREFNENEIPLKPAEYMNLLGNAITQLKEPMGWEPRYDADQQEEFIVKVTLCALYSLMLVKEMSEIIEK